MKDIRNVTLFFHELELNIAGRAEPRAAVLDYNRDMKLIRQSPTAQLTKLVGSVGYPLYLMPPNLSVPDEPN